MLKNRSLILLLCLALLVLCTGCDRLDALKAVEVEPLELPKEEEPAPTEDPDAAGTEESPEPAPALQSEEVSPVTVHNSLHTEEFFAPDDSAERILTFEYDEPVVSIPDNPQAEESINDAIRLANETFYSGDAEGYGLNVYLEAALDNYSFTISNGWPASPEYYCGRTLQSLRCDEHVISLVFNDSFYMGGTHGSYRTTALNFSAVTGKLLTLDSIAESEDLRGSLEEQLVVLAEKENATQEFYTDFQTTEELDAAVRQLVREGSWYLTDNGIVFFSQLYEFAGYAAGIYDYEIPYDALAGLIDDDLLPSAHAAAAVVTAVPLADSTGEQPIADYVALSEDGEDLLIVFQGGAENLQLSTVSYSAYSETYYRQAIRYRCSYLADGALQLKANIPEGLPNLLLEYQAGDGTSFQCFLTRDGDTGVLCLTSGDVSIVG